MIKKFIYPINEEGGDGGAASGQGVATLGSVVGVGSEFTPPFVDDDDEEEDEEISEILQNGILQNFSEFEVANAINEEIESATTYEINDVVKTLQEKDVDDSVILKIKNLLDGENIISRSDLEYTLASMGVDISYINDFVHDLRSQ